MSPDDLLSTALHGDAIDGIAAIRDLRQLLKQAEHDHINTLRRHGASWAFIGRQLNITRQAALDHYGHWQPTQT